jgi:hypothetical protein
MHISSYIRRRTELGKGSGNEEKKRASHKLLGVETVDISCKILHWTLSGEDLSHIFFSFDFDPKMNTPFIQDRVLRIMKKVKSDHTPRLSTSQLFYTFDSSSALPAEYLFQVFSSNLSAGLTR